jgi:hypothetical protein
MSNARHSTRTPVAYDLKARYALGRAVGALARELPLPLADWRRCADEVLQALAGGNVDSGEGATLRQVREALFEAPGHESEMTALWRESLATATFGGAFSTLRGQDAAAAAVAGLLHRAGEAGALRALAISESASGVQIDPAARAQVTGPHTAAFLDALVRGWRLPPEVAVAVRGWSCFGEFATNTAATAVYIGNLLAQELIRPDACAPGILESASGDLKVDAAEIETLRASTPAAQLLIQRLG